MIQLTKCSNTHRDCEVTWSTPHPRLTNPPHDWVLRGSGIRSLRSTINAWDEFLPAYKEKHNSSTEILPSQMLKSNLGWNKTKKFNSLSKMYFTCLYENVWMKTNARTWLKSQSAKLEFPFLAIFGACGYTDTSPRTLVRITFNSFRDTTNSIVTFVTDLLVKFPNSLISSVEKKARSGQ